MEKVSKMHSDKHGPEARSSALTEFPPEEVLYFIAELIE